MAPCRRGDHDRDAASLTTVASVTLVARFGFPFSSLTAIPFRVMNLFFDLSVLTAASK
jgi:hypothetical protein